MRRFDEQATSPIIGIMVALAIFTTVTAYVVDFGVNEAEPGNQSERAEYESLSQQMANLMVGRGTNWHDTGEARCMAGGENLDALEPDQLGDLRGGQPASRFGLGEEDCFDRASAVGLSYGKMASLYQGEMAASDNDKLDYEEAHRGLGLEFRGLDFHIRSWPAMPDAREVLETGVGDPYLKVAYVGNYVKNANLPRLVNHQSGVVDGLDHATAWILVTNNGTTSTVFEAQVSVPLSQGTAYATLHTPLVASGASYNMTLKLWKSSDWQWRSQGVYPGSVRVCTILLDPLGNVVTGVTVPGSAVKVYSTEAPTGYSGAGSFQPVTFTTPTTPNADLVGLDAINDALCTIRGNLPLGNYYYGQTQITSAGGWAAPKYYDNNAGISYPLADFATYSNELFTASQTDDAGRNQRSDGQVALSALQPSQTIVVLNQLIGIGAAYTGPIDPVISFPRDISFILSDVEGEVGRDHIDFTLINMLSATDRDQLFVHADKPWFNITGLPSVTARVHYVTYQGDGSQQVFADWRMRIYRPDSTLLSSDFLLPSTGNFQPYSLSATGTHTAKLQNLGFTTTWNEARVSVLAGPIAAFTPGVSAGHYLPAASAKSETTYLGLLLERFLPNAYSPLYTATDLTYASGGDVFPDVKEVMNNELSGWLLDGASASLEDYNVLVIGSGVDHQSMTSNAITDAVELWVEAGGTLIVFGSAQQSVQWLSNLFASSIETASGGLYTPDIDHPVLETPNDLEYGNFQRLSTWSFQPAERTKFTHVLKQGPGADDPDLLAVSDAGSFGRGRIALTGFQPYSLTANQATACPTPLTSTDACPSLQFIQNLLTQAYRELFLDYGPAVPSGSANAVSTRMGVVHHPDLDQDIILTIQVYAFES